ncbi:MAG: hypothetical protein KGZ66_10875 [Selenomonadales bacterium]|nr:hypothetical protein [Selenomonadales bacterium]
MKSFWRLLKVTLLNHFHISVMQETYFEKRERQWEPLVFGLAVIVGGGSFGSMLFFAARSLLAVLPLAFSDLVLLLAILATQLLMLGFGLASLISLFYFSTDLSVLVPLPLREWTILAAKFVVASITEYLLPIVILLPVLIAYNRHVPLGVLGILSALLVFVLLPAIPLSLAGIATLTLMRGVGRRHRDILVVVASLVLVVGMLALQYFIQSMAMGSLDIGAVLEGRIDLVAALGSRFPPSVWATRAIAGAGNPIGLANLMYLTFASLASVGAFLLVGQRVFYRGLVGGEERLRQRTRLDGKSLAQVVRTPSLTALVLREIRLFMRMPIWVLNGFLAVVIVPLMSLFPALTGNGGLRQLTALLAENPQGETILMLAIAAFVTAMSSMNTVACTAVSREGKYLWISKSIPVMPVTQVKAKLIFALLCTALTGILLAVFFAVLFSPSVSTLLVAVALGFVASIAPQALGLAFDIWRPFLKWTTPQHAVKNNLNALTALLACVPLGVVSYYLYLWLHEPLGTLFVPALLVLHLVAATASVSFTLRKAAEYYDRLEVTA